MRKLKTFLVVTSIFLLVLLNPLAIDRHVAKAQEIHSDWYALIVCGSTGSTFRNNTEYMYHVLSEHYGFDGIVYLSVYADDPGVADSATIGNVRSAITSTLHSWSDANDIVFIYFTSHGGGYLHRTEAIGATYSDQIPWAIADGRYDAGGDEGNEHSEATLHLPCLILNALYDLDGDGQYDDLIRNLNDDPLIEVDLNNDGTIEGAVWLDDLDGDGQNDDIFVDPDRDDRCDVAINADTDHDGETLENTVSDGEDSDQDAWIVGIDLNGDGDHVDWFGVDESLQVQDGWYWDDELANDLNTITCSNLIFVRQGCVEGNQSCFGGGLIDDLSAPNRVIMCATNETWFSFADIDHDRGLSEWSEAFIDALHGEEAFYNPQTQQIVHTGIDVNADLDNDGRISLEESWDYAWNHDDARINGLETPWFDDDGDGLPTFTEGSDLFDTDGQGDLASQIHFEPNLATILSELGFTSIEESAVETFEPGWYEITLYAELASYHESNDLSWYPTGTTQYNLIFSGVEGGLGYVEPPITKAFTATTQFGISFCSPEARYFTETSRNPDGLKHAQVYRNLNNPNMYLIGFENMLGVGDEDYNDMVISLEINKPPNSPSTPSGPSSGYVYETYSYTTSATDPNGDDVCYEFLWGSDGTETTGWYESGANATESHIWNRPGKRKIWVRALDTHNASSGWSWPLDVNITQNDASSGGDAGNNFTSALLIDDPKTNPQYYNGTLYQYNPEDKHDWYQFSVASNKEIHIILTSPTNADFNLELRDLNGVLRQSSTMPAGYVDAIDYVTDMSGNWTIHVNASSGEGLYEFSTRISEPGGGGEPCPTLFAWNGSGYVDYGVIDIHDSSGEDVVQEVQINKTDVAVSNYQAKFRLQEGWQGLNFSESVIDQVKLYAVDSAGNRYLCPLITAEHSSLGNVWLKILFSDDYKAQILLLETIDLTFIVPYQNIQSYVFVIEGCNQFKQ